MKKQVLFLLIPLPFLLQSCFAFDLLKCAREPRSLKPADAYLDGNFFLYKPSLFFDKDGIGSRTCNIEDDGVLYIYLLYGTFIQESGWNAIVNLLFFSEDETKYYSDSIPDCCSQKYHATYETDWLDVGWNKYTYSVGQANLFENKFKFSFFENKFKFSLFSITFYDTNDNKFASLSSTAKIIYDGNTITSFQFQKFEKEMSLEYEN